MDNSTTRQTQSLYSRLGGESGVRNIVNDVLDKNSSNPLISHHFRNSDMGKLKQLVFEFFSMGTGGPHKYTGRDMRSSHTGMNGIGHQEKDEVIAILESLKGEIVGI